MALRSGLYKWSQGQTQRPGPPGSHSISPQTSVHSCLVPPALAIPTYTLADLRQHNGDHPSTFQATGKELRSFWQSKTMPAALLQQGEALVECAASGQPSLGRLTPPPSPLHPPKGPCATKTSSREPECMIFFFPFKSPGCSPEEGNGLSGAFQA